MIKIKNEIFKLVLEGVAGNGTRSYIAIDDLITGPTCIPYNQELPPIVTTTKTTTSTTTTSTRTTTTITYTQKTTTTTISIDKPETTTKISTISPNCPTNVCLNGGLCVYTQVSGVCICKCECPSEFTGTNCETPISIEQPKKKCIKTFNYII